MLHLYYHTPSYTHTYCTVCTVCVCAATRIQAEEKGNKEEQMCKVFLDAQRQKQTGFTEEEEEKEKDID